MAVTGEGKIMRDDWSETRYGTGVSRRTFLAAVGIGAGATGLTLPASATPRKAGGPARFAVITDTHADLDSGSRTDALTRVLHHINSRDPDFVLNCGDITDYGVEDEFALYRSTIPPELASRMHHVPGNHEAQWNADAWEQFRRVFGPTHYSFDAAGLHVVAMDPFVPQEWPPWHFSDHLIDFIRRDLAAVRDRRPTVVFNHFPLSGDWFFVNNRERLLDVITAHPVRAAFSGHIHRRQVSKFNGLTQVVGNAIINTAVYYWVERRTDAQGDRLVVSEVLVPASGDATETVITTAPLSDPGPGGALGPLRTRTGLGAGGATVTVSAPPAAGQVSARLYPQGAAAASWSPLAASGASWTGTLDVSGLAPGIHRIQVRAADDTDGFWDAVAPLRIPPKGVRVAWTHRLGQTVMAGLSGYKDLVVVGTTDGHIEAFTVSPGALRSRWRRNLGGIYKAPVFLGDGSAVLVGSADHTITALNGATGRTVWQRDLGAPVMSDTAVLPSGRIVVAAGSTLFCLGPAGSTAWQADLNGSFTGQACSDGDRVFAGSADGNTYAFDAATGKKLWATPSASTSDNAYHRIIYGPWGAQLAILPTGDVLVPTHLAALALDPTSGAVRWTVDGLARVEFTRPTVSEYGALIFNGKTGEAHLLDPATGDELWSDATLPASWGAAPVPTADPGVYLMASNNGLLTRIDLKNRVVTPLLQISTSFSTSTAVLVGEGHRILVTADNEGSLNGVVGA